MSLICLTHPEHTRTRVVRNQQEVEQAWVVGEHIVSFHQAADGALHVSMVNGTNWYVSARDDDNHAFEVLCDEIFKLLDRP